MQTGLLWYDGDPKRPVTHKVEEAAERYLEKFGAEPNTCYVHPTTLPEGLIVPGFELRTATWLRPNHFWLGIAADAEPAPRAPKAEKPPMIDAAPKTRARKKCNAA